jgi:AbiV family abortive infection protein
MAESNQPLKTGILEDRFARLGLENTRSLLRSADALAGIQHYGHGLALVSLALEELETAHAYRLVADGIATFDPDEARALQFIDKRALLMHTPKLILLGERMLTFFYMRQTAKVIRRIRGHKPTPEEVMSVMMGADAKLSPEVKKVLDSPDAVREGRAIKEDLHKLKDLKNRGLYVSEGEGRVTDPSSITEQEFRHYRDIANQLMQVFEETTENGYPFPVAEGLRQSYAAYRKTHKRLEGPLNPKRIGDEDKTRSDYDVDPLVGVEVSQDESPADDRPKSL